MPYLVAGLSFPSTAHLCTAIALILVGASLGVIWSRMFKRRRSLWWLAVPFSVATVLFVPQLLLSGGWWHYPTVLWMQPHTVLELAAAKKPDVWRNQLKVRPGQKVRLRLRYFNDGDSTARGVAVRLVLPSGVRGCPDDPVLINSHYPNGWSLAPVAAGGLFSGQPPQVFSRPAEIGDYYPGADGYVIVSIRVAKTPPATWKPGLPLSITAEGWCDQLGLQATDAQLVVDYR